MFPKLRFTVYGFPFSEWTDGYLTHFFVEVIISNFKLCPQKNVTKKGCFAELLSTTSVVLRKSTNKTMVGGHF